ALSASGPTPISGAGGAESDVKAGSYTLSESGGPAGYTAGSFSCTNGVAVTAGQITLALNQSTVCAINNDDQTAHLKLVKTMASDNVGTVSLPAALPTSTGPTPISGAGGAESDVKAGTYTLSESGGPAGYTAGSFSCTNGVTVTAGQVMLALNQSTVCTINNDDQPGTLTVIKHVITDNGGTKTAADFTMSVSGTNVQPSPSFPGAEAPGTTVTLNAGSYSVDEAAASGYTKTIGTGCSGTIGNGEAKSCTITNDDQTASLTVITVVIGGPKSASDFTMSVTGDNANPTPHVGVASP